MGNLKHECAVFAAIGGADCVAYTYTGLKALQHRGQDWFGVAAKQKHEITLIRQKGLVAASCEKPRFRALVGNPAIGHTRYATTGPSTVINAQPHLSQDGTIALCANGDVVPSDYKKWRAMMESYGYPCRSSNDGELLLRLVEWRLAEQDTIVSALQFLQRNVTGAFSGAVIHESKLVAFRDVLGMRPLVFGHQADSTYCFVASEDCALKKVGVDSWQEIEPGEVMVIDRQGNWMSNYLPQQRRAHCVFCHIYFGFPTSTLFGIPVNICRRKQGQLLASTLPENTDIIMAVPDSSNDAALGLSHESGIPFEFGLYRPHHQGRSFIAPSRQQRENIADDKLVVSENVIRGKVVVLVDDSIVRGTTSKLIIAKLRRAGAKEIHVRIVAPKIVNPCFYGIATPTKEQLIGSSQTEEEIRVAIGADSLYFLSVDDHKDIIRSFGKDPNDYCFACFDGNYPTKL